MVKLVQEMFKKRPRRHLQGGLDPSTKEFHDRDLYVFIYDMAGVCVAHGARRALIGKNLIDIKDQDGTYLIRRMVEIANGAGSGWVDYRWPNPQTNKIEDKSSYVKRWEIFCWRRSLPAMTSVGGAVTPPERARPRQASSAVRSVLGILIICRSK